jgi:hypothetical protein
MRLLFVCFRLEHFPERLSFKYDMVTGMGKPVKDRIGDHGIREKPGKSVKARLEVGMIECWRKRPSTIA